MSALLPLNGYLFWDVCISAQRLSSSDPLSVFRQRLFENLRMLPHAPGVQMQAIPEDAVQEDSGDEEDDPDKRIPSESTVFSHARYF